MNFVLKKLKSLLFSPIITIKKIFLKLQTTFLIFFYNFDKYKEKQSYIFSKLNLNREEGLKIFEEEKSNNKIFDGAMSSEHKVLFASISASKKKIQEILEIGTYDGENSYFLSRIFPEAKITTIDLEDDNEYFKKSYNRESIEKRKKFCLERDKILSLSGNIKFKKMNSVELNNFLNKFDLIWVDGAHGYPHAAIDITNSIRLLKDNGMLLCDDVWKSKPLIQDDMYNSLASYQTLLAFKENEMIEFETIFKRLDKYNNSNKHFRKYIAVVKKLS